MLQRFIYTILSIIILTTLNAQNEKQIEAQKKAGYDTLKKLSREEWRNLYKTKHARVPEGHKSSDIEKKSLLQNTEKSQSEKIKKSSQAAFRADARFSGEFEELQGVFVSWPYADPPTNLLIDTVEGSPYAYIYEQLVDDIQKSGAKAYINVSNASDSNAIKAKMSEVGRPLSNYRFLVYLGDDIWARDFGPIPYYYSAQDSIGWLDYKYYDGRDSDNVLPIKWGKELNIPVRTTPIGYEGGNILMDGRGKLSTTTMVLDANLFDYGFTNQTVKDSLNYLMNLNRRDILPYLPHDGGTGHIDLYIDMMDENTYVFAKFPTAMQSIPAFADYGIAAKNLDTLKTRKTADGNSFRFKYLPLPTRDNGTWYTSGTNYENYTRTYANHLIVNKSIIQPIFHDNTSGNAAGDAAAIDSIKKAYPGYTIRPIDMRDFDGFGGSIHCITKEFPAENPLTIWHYAYDGETPFQSPFPINATIHNKSGIASAKVYYRSKGTTTWKSNNFSLVSGENFTSTIPASAAGDTVEYYISATSNNGKTITKPMTAPDGFYTFWYGIGVTSIQNTDLGKFTSMYPNPAKDYTEIDFTVNSKATVSVQIINAAGSICKTLQYTDVMGENSLQIRLSELAAGFYTVHISIDNQKAFSGKLIKMD